MENFKLITVKDKELITHHTLPAFSQDCDLSFANLCSWQFITESCFTIMDNRLIIRFAHPEYGHEYFLPADGKEVAPLIPTLERAAQTAGERLCLRLTMPTQREELERIRPEGFIFETDRDYSDYIYDREALVELKGKNYQPKRNHVNKFHKEYISSLLPLTEKDIPECMEFEASWCVKHGYEENENIRNERRALIFAFQHFKELELTGAIIRIDGKIAAFTFGAPINHSTFGVHYEKADIHIDGSYSAINQHFASNIPNQYMYLNREEDLGIPGLRQAKLSYHPVLLLEKTRAVQK